LGRQRGALLLLEDRADSELAGTDQPVFLGIELAVAVGVDMPAPGVAPQPALVGRIGVAAPPAVVAGHVGAVLALAVDHAQQHAETVVGEGMAVGRRQLAAVELGHQVAVAFQAHDAVLAAAVEGAGRTQVDQAADRAFRQRGLRALDHVRAADHVGGQHVVGEVAAGAIGGEDAAVERGQGVLGPACAHAQALALAAGGARERHAGAVAARIGHGVVGALAQVQRADRVTAGGRLAVNVVSVYSGPSPRTLTRWPSPPAVREIDTPVMWLSESATLSSGNLPSSSALIESCTVDDSRLSSVARARLPRTPVTTTASRDSISPSACATGTACSACCARSTLGASASAMPQKRVLRC